LQTWKYSKLHIVDVIRNVDPSKLGNEWHYSVLLYFYVFLYIFVATAVILGARGIRVSGQLPFIFKT
jgi:hypothetical protein